MPQPNSDDPSARMKAGLALTRAGMKVITDALKAEMKRWHVG